MARLKFDRDAVSENIKRLLSMGVGTRAPASEGGAPVFTNRDIQVHAQSIGRTLGPPGVQEPLGVRVDGQGLNFRSLDNPSFQSIDDITIKIGELEGRKRETNAELASFLAADPTVVSAQTMVNTLSNELAITNDENTRLVIQEELRRATILLNNASEQAVKNVGIQQTKNNALVDAEIVRLQAQQKVLLDQEDRTVRAAEEERREAEDESRRLQEIELKKQRIEAERGRGRAAAAEIERITARERALVEEARKAKAFKLAQVPKNTVEQINYVISTGRAKTAPQADRFIESAPPITQEMIRRQVDGILAGRPVEIFNPLVDAGGRNMFEAAILANVPPTDQEAVRLEITQNRADMVDARKLAKKPSETKEARAEELLAGRADPDAQARRELERFDGLMRENTLANFEKRIFRLSPNDLDPTWFPGGEEQLALAQKFISFLNPEDESIETGFATAANQLMRQGIERQDIINTIGRILDNQKSEWNNIHKHLGTSVTELTLRDKEAAFSFNLLAVIRLDRERELTEERFREKFVIGGGS